MMGAILLLPGLLPAAFLAIAGAGWNVHDPNETVLYLLTPTFNVLFYTSVAYVIPRWRWFIGRETKS